MKKLISEYKIYILIFLFIFVFNSITPRIMDDYQYSFIYGLDNLIRVNSFSDLVMSQYNHYFLWGGRTVAHTIAQFFLMFPKMIFNVANSFVFCGVIYLILEHAAIFGVKKKWYMPLLVSLALWFTLPEFGQTILWLTGSCNYLWGSFFILLALLLFSHQYKNPEYRMNNGVGVFYAVISFLGGWSNENTSGALILLMIIYLIILKCNKIKIDKFLWISLVVTIVGFVLMIVAPGNFIRKAAAQPISDLFIVEYLNRFANCTLIFKKCLFIIFAITIVLELYNIIICRNKRSIIVTSIFLLGSLACNYAMILSPFYVTRASFGAIIFALVGLFSAIQNISFENSKERFALYTVVSIFSMSFLITASFALIDDFSSFYFYKKREAQIVSAAENHEKEVFTYKIEGKTKYNALYHQDDLVSESDPFRYLNKYYEGYYNIGKVRID